MQNTSPKSADTPTLLESALAYARRGWHLYRCWPATNNPSISSNGNQSAATDEAQITRWWTRDPKCNMGVHLKRSGLVVLDVDRHSGAPDGFESLAKLEFRFGKLPPTLVATTPRNGRHYYFSVADGIVVPQIDKRAYPGIDLLWNGGSCLPPSYRDELKDGEQITGHYQWIGETVPVAPFPPEWIAGVDALADSRASVRENIPEDAPLDVGDRNGALFRLGCALRHHGSNEERIYETLAKENETRCNPPLPDDEVQEIARSAMRYNPAENNQNGSLKSANTPTLRPWEEPKPIQAGLHRVPALDVDATLPPLAAEWCREITRPMFSPIEFAVVPLLTALGGCLGNAVVVQPKQNDDRWRVVPNLFGCVVGKPGATKTPVAQAALAPLHTIAAELSKEHQQRMQDYETKLADYESAMDQWKVARKNARKDDLSEPPKPTHPGDPPIENRITTGFASTEKMIELAQQNPDGLICMSDEIAGWLASMTMTGHDMERTFWLSGWDGNSPYDYDTKSGGHQHVDHLTLSVIGGIQPGKLRGILQSVIDDPTQNDGLMERLQLFAWPDPITDWEYVDEKPDALLAMKVEALFHDILILRNSLDKPRILRFDAEAQAVFIEWLTRMEKRNRKPDESAKLTGHFSKYRSLFPSLAAIFQMIEDTTSIIITAQNARRAELMCRWLAEHALRIFQSVWASEGAQNLGEHVQLGDLGNSFAYRDVRLHRWSHLGNKYEILNALDALESAGWLQDGGNRRYYVNPALLENANTPTPAAGTGRPNTKT